MAMNVSERLAYSRVGVSNRLVRIRWWKVYWSSYGHRLWKS